MTIDFTFFRGKIKVGGSNTHVNPLNIGGKGIAVARFFSLIKMTAFRWRT